MKKVWGLILMILGFVLLLSNMNPLNKISDKIVPDALQNYVIGAGAVLVFIGLFLARRANSFGKNDLLPIYQGKKVVGYHKGKR
jgi:hypothetical protein